MTTRIGINGFGRIGRQVLRAMRERHPDTLEVVAVNDLGKPADNARLFKYDSTYGRYPGAVEATENSVVIDGERDCGSRRARSVQTALGRIWARTLLSSPPASSRTRQARAATSRAAPRRSSYRLRRAARI